MPTFLVIGAQKAGTTSLYYYLKHHPQIYMSPVKEPNFFAYEGEELDYRGPGFNPDNIVADIESYRALFAGVSDEKAIGEASPSTLYSPQAPLRIRQHIPDAKLIAVLRNPVERAYSNYLHCVRRGQEPLKSFSQALAAEEQRIRDRWSPLWHYQRSGFYHEQLTRYLQVFDRDQIQIHLFDTLIANPSRVLRDIYAFLGVDETFLPDTSVRHNVSGVPRSRVWRSLVSTLEPAIPFLKRAIPHSLRQRIRSLVFVRPRLAPDEYRKLADVFREDIAKLQDLIQTDLSGWLEC